MYWCAAVGAVVGPPNNLPVDGDLSPIDVRWTSLFFIFTFSIPHTQVFMECWNADNNKPNDRL